MKTSLSDTRAYLIGAGPGDPGLITLRGVECLRMADLILYDYLVNPAILDHARPDAELVCLGRHGSGRIMPQSEINQRMVQGALAGRIVARLKAGDPAIFARAAEECEALTAAGVRYEMVPGITAALAVGSYAGVPLTHRDHASAVALVTGHETFDKPQSSLDYAALAHFPGTLVFYMGVTSAPVWSQALIAAGKPASTPVAIVRRVSWSDQSIHRCTLGTLPRFVVEQHLRPPVISIVGEVARLSPVVSWFTDRPLFQKQVLITRPAGQRDNLPHALQQLGATVLTQPAIEISAPVDLAAVDAAIDQVKTLDWLVFASANGVRYFLNRLWNGAGDLRALASVHIAVIGSGTAEALAEFKLKADLVPESYRAESLADALAAQARDKRFLLVRASRGREVLAERITAAGGQVSQVVAYCSRDITEPRPEILTAMEEGKVTWTTVTSSAIARSLAGMFGPALQQTRLVSISPITSQTLREVGLAPAIEAQVYSMDGILAAIRQDALAALK